MRVDDVSAGFLVATAAFLGCMAPIWTDALQALKRFRSLATIEITGALARFATMLAAMPVKALSGFFAAQAALPAFRIAASVVALKNDLALQAEPFWNRTSLKRMAAAFIAILVYQGVPMSVSMLERSILRDALSSADSAAYYMVSRFSDFLHYLTFPMLLVMFPYTAAAAARGNSTMPYVIRCMAATLAAASIMALVYWLFGAQLLSLMPNGANYRAYAIYMPFLVLITALTSCQVFHTNAEVSAGRFTFLKWFIPLHLIYAAALYTAHSAKAIDSLHEIIICFAVAGFLRLLFCLPFRRYFLR
jgi:hypothetical protein